MKRQRVMEGLTVSEYEATRTVKVTGNHGAALRTILLHGLLQRLQYAMDAGYPMLVAGEELVMVRDSLTLLAKHLTDAINAIDLEDAAPPPAHEEKHET